MTIMVLDCEKLKNRLYEAKKFMPELADSLSKINSFQDLVKIRERLGTIFDYIDKVISGIMEDLAQEDFSKILLEGNPNFLAMDGLPPKTSDLRGIVTWVKNRTHFNHKKRKLVFDDDLVLTASNVNRLPKNFIVHGSVNLYKTPMKELPEGLEVMGDFLADETELENIPEGLVFGADVYLRINKNLINLPENFEVSGHLDIQQTPIGSLPDTLRVGTDIFINSDLRDRAKELKSMGKIKGDIFVMNV